MINWVKRILTYLKPFFSYAYYTYFTIRNKIRIIRTVALWLEVWTSPVASPPSHWLNAPGARFANYWTDPGTTSFVLTAVFLVCHGLDGCHVYAQRSRAMCYGHVSFRPSVAHLNNDQLSPTNAASRRTCNEQIRWTLSVINLRTSYVDNASRRKSPLYSYRTCI